MPRRSYRPLAGVSVVAVVLGILLGSNAPGRAAAQQVPVFRGGVDLVNVGVTVTDRKGNLVTDLTVDDFEIYEDGKKQTPRYFSAGLVSGPGDPPMHLGLLLDVSESMGEDIAFTKTAAVKFLNTLTEAADITFVDFDTEVRATRYSQADFARVIERIRQQKARGWTALYDAIGVYLNGAQNQDGQKVLVLYTDGGDTTSSLTFHDMLDLLKVSDVTVYVVGYLEHQSSSGRLQQRSELDRVATVTGGQSYFPGASKDLDGVFDKIREELAARYSLGYLSTDPRKDGAWRNVEIKLVRSDLKNVRLRTRSGYYAPYQAGR